MVAFVCRLCLVALGVFVEGGWIGGWRFRIGLGLCDWYMDVVCGVAFCVGRCVTWEGSVIVCVVWVGVGRWVGNEVG